MKKVTTFIALIAVFSVVFAGTPDKGRISGEKAVPIIEPANEVSNPVFAPIKKNTAYVPTQISNLVGNLRSVLGVGRNIWTDESGVIHVSYLTGTAGTYKIWYAQSVDNGATFDLDGPLGEFYPGDDRYPGLFVNSNGVYIAYNELGVPAAGLRAPMMLYNAVPFTNAWVGNNTSGLWTGPILNYLLSNAGGSPTRAFGTYYDAGALKKCPIVGETAVNAWAPIGFMGDTTRSKGSAPGIVASGTYVLATWGAVLDTTTTPAMDPIIIRNMAGSSGTEFMMYSESNDGGATWSPAALVVGTNYTDYPPMNIDTSGVITPVRIAGPTGWNNEYNPIIVNGKAYIISNTETLDPNKYFSGLSSVVISQKPVGLGGAWTHSVASVPPTWVTGTGVVRGNCWYAEIGSVMGYPNLMYVAATDRSATPDQIVVFGSNDGGLTWNQRPPIRISNDSLLVGLPTAATNFISTSPNAVYVNPNNIFLDITFLLDNSGVVNTSQYHVRVNIAPLFGLVGVSEKDPVAKGFDLDQNYPNPFNPSTTIKYTLGANSNVSLKIYNAMGQEVRALVNGKSQVANTPYEVRWDGKDNAGNAVASGVYMYRLEAGNVKMTKKMMFLK